MLVTMPLSAENRQESCALKYRSNIGRSVVCVWLRDMLGVDKGSRFDSQSVFTLFFDSRYLKHWRKRLICGIFVLVFFFTVAYHNNTL